MANLTHGGTPIFRAPVALQDFLSSKAVGRNPDILGEVVQPSLEMGPFLSLGIPQEVASVSSVVAVPAVGQIMALSPVPPGEVWLITSYQISGSVANQAVAVRAAARNNSTGEVFWISQYLGAVNAVTTQVFGVGEYFGSNWFVLRPDQSFLTYATQVNAGATDLSLVLRVAFYRLAF